MVIRILAIALLAGGMGMTAAQAQESQAQSQGKAPRDAQAAAQQAQGQCPERFAVLESGQERNVTPREEQAVRDKVFEALDGDGNNVVSRAEIKECLAKTPAFSEAGLDNLLDRSDSRFGELDRNDDKRISWQEYVQSAKAGHEKAGREGATGLIGWTFAKIDSDLSGYLTIDEWGMNWTGTEAAEATDRSFQNLDADGDGRITREEYRKAGDRKASVPQGGEGDRQAAAVTIDGKKMTPAELIGRDVVTDGGKRIGRVAGVIRRDGTPNEILVELEQENRQMGMTREAPSKMEGKAVDEPVIVGGSTVAFPAEHFERAGNGKTIMIARRHLTTVGGWPPRN